MSLVYPAQVAGMFYPADPSELKRAIEEFLSECVVGNEIPKAMIVPHAGYRCSGKTAAKAYVILKKAEHWMKRVVLFGPSHRVPFNGVAVATAEFFETPLGQISVDQKAIQQALTLSSVQSVNTVFYGEHCLEVQLPFLQTVLSDFTIIPFLIGNASEDQVSEIMELLWNGKETLILVSSDLSHYYDYATAKKLDQLAVEAVLDLDAERIDIEQACGRIGMQALLKVAKKKGLIPQLLDLRNSGDTCGPKHQVVGYGSFGFYER